ncbi:hypothetical protein D3C74_330960 [compost metagenome]
MTENAAVSNRLGRSPGWAYSVSKLSPRDTPRWTTIVWGSVSASMPSRPCLRPWPDDLNPPMGAETDPNAEA